MRLLKSSFITCFTIYLILIVAFALLQTRRGIDPVSSWIGLMLSGLGPLLFFGWIYLKRPVRTASHPVGYSIIAGLGLAIALATSWKYGHAAGSVHVWAGIAVIGWFLYLRWYSRMGNPESNNLAPGSHLPHFDLLDLEGGVVHSGSFRGQAHVLLFYRGNWCPFCTAQIRELAQAFRDLSSIGAETILISPQSLVKSRQLATRIGIPMRFLQDPGSHAARILGLFDAWGTPMGLQVLGYDSDTVLPATIVVDADGIIMHSRLSANYRIRPEPGEILDLLKKQRQY